MAMDEVKDEYTAWKGQNGGNPSWDARQMRFPANAVVCLSEGKLSTTPYTALKIAKSGI